MRIRSPLGAAVVCLLAISSGAADLAPPLLLTTNGVIRNYTNFFDANRDLMVAALGEGFGGGGGTNAWKIQINGSDVASPTIDSSSTVKAQAAGSSVTLTVQTNSIRTNELASATLSYLLNRANQSGTMGWSFITGAPTTLSGYGITDAQGADTDLAAVAGLSSVGLITRTASGTAAARTITGDTEIAVSNGDGVAGNPTLSIGAAIARVAAIASGYQPLANILSRLSGIGLGTSGDVLIRDATGWTNLAKSTDGKVLKLASGLPAWGDDNTGGGGGGNASTNQSQTFAAGTTQRFEADVQLAGNTSVDQLTIGSASFGGIWGFSNGGHGASNATQARVNLGVVPDQDVQAFRVGLLQLAIALAADGDMPYRNAAGIITNLISTTAGRALLSAVNAAAQWALLQSSATTNGAYSASSWDGITDRVPNLDQFRDAMVAISNSVTSAESPLVLSNGTILLNTNGLVLSGSSPYDPMADYPDWQVATWSFDSSSAAMALEPGLVNTAVNSGSFANQTNYVFSGTGGMFCKAAASVDTETGGAICLNGSSATTAYTALGTNVNRFRADLFFATANPTVAIIGMSDFFSTTQNPSDAVVWTVTNMVARPAAMSNSVTVYSSSTFSLQPSVSYSFEVSQTNTSARFLIYSNNVAVSDIMLTNGLPMNATNLLSPVMVYVKNNGSTALTNSATMMVVDRIRSARKLR